MRAADGNFRKESDHKYVNPHTDLDGIKWTLLETRYACGDWIEEQNSEWWKNEGHRMRARYWVRDELLMLLELKWGT